MIIINTCPKCGHDLTNLIITTNPPIPKKECHNCGWSWEGKREDVKIVPFNSNNINSDNNSPCDKCNNNIKNGGTGICHCTLGQKNITY